MGLSWRKRSAVLCVETARLLVAAIVALVATVVVAASACVWPVHFARTPLQGDEAMRKFQDVAHGLDWGPMTTYDSVTCEVSHGLAFTHSSFAFRRIYQRPEGSTRQWSASTFATATEYGWPLRCFIGDNFTFLSGTSPNQSMGVVARLQELTRQSRLLAPRLIANVVIVAIALRFAPAMLRAIRARYRSARGRCARCGYYLIAGAVCSECGASHAGKGARG
jgi:hypothetical protein